MATMNISLPDKMKKWVEAQIETGRYANTSDYMRDLVRREESRQRVIGDIREALAEGEASGSVPYSRRDIEDMVSIKAKRNAA